MAAPVYQALAQSDSGNTDTVSATAPSGTASTDLCLAFVCIDINTQTVTTVGSGYTLLHGPQDGGNGDERIYVYTGVNTGTTTWVISAARNWSVVIVRVSGQHASTPVDDSATGSGSAANSTAQPLPSGVTTTQADTLAVSLVCSDQTTVTPPTLTPPTTGSAWTERLDGENAGANMVIGIASLTIAAASTAVTGDWTLGSSDRAAVATVVVAPAAGGVTGVGAAAFGGTFTASGVPEVFGVATAAFGFTGAAAGQPRTFGVADASLGGTFTALGIDRALGAAVAALGFTGSASGVAGAPPVTGVGTGAFGGTFAASGLPTVRGAALAAFGFTGAALGQPRTFGAGVATFGGTFTASGVPRPLGVAAAVFGFTGTAQGVDRALGLAVASFGFTGSASGTVSGGSEVFGVAAGAFGFTGTASGVPQTFGVAAALFGFSAAASGITPVTTPDGRTFAVVASNRTGSVPADPARVITPGASPRTTGA